MKPAVSKTWAVGGVVLHGTTRLGTSTLSYNRLSVTQTSYYNRNWYMGKVIRSSQIVSPLMQLTTSSKQDLSNCVRRRYRLNMLSARLEQLCPSTLSSKHAKVDTCNKHHTGANAITNKGV